MPTYLPEYITVSSLIDKVPGHKPTNVRLAMFIEGMSSFRTQTMDFQLDVYFQQFWKDRRLAHNESRRILIRDKRTLAKIWHPDIYFANARIAEFHEVTQPNFLLWIEPNGSILYDTRISMVVVCTLNLEKWPLDTQRCHLRILSYAYTTDQLQIEWIKGTPITRNPNIAMSDMQIVDLFPGLCDGNYSTGTWSCVTAEFFVKREVTHHVMQSYVPTTLIVVISWFSFWLDVEAVPARVSLAITTLLTLSTQANAARMALPEVSYMKAIDVWMGACMMFVFGVMIEFTIVNYAQRKATAESASTKSQREGVAKGAQIILDYFGINRQTTLEEEDLLDHLVSNGNLYDPPYVRSSRKPLLYCNNCHKVDLEMQWRQSNDKTVTVKANTINRIGKKEAARRRAKQIDQKSRWVFPLSFLAFNALYWSYYLYFKS
ncbi:Cation transporter family protein [Dictyocaulus viviparus]|uniref:Cation transporter family protein n=1 Tax=Dictyocaulus viviparus TaxID=29172 RepID=A0A0D8XD91_DICVI|nr:Cation transporter family protein [Dictyocaulus viviparus]